MKETTSKVEATLSARDYWLADRGISNVEYATHHQSNPAEAMTIFHDSIVMLIIDSPRESLNESERQMVERLSNAVNGASILFMKQLRSELWLSIKSSLPMIKAVVFIGFESDAQSECRAIHSQYFSMADLIFAPNVSKLAVDKSLKLQLWKDLQQVLES